MYDDTDHFDHINGSCYGIQIVQVIL